VSIFSYIGFDIERDLERFTVFYFTPVKDFYENYKSRVPKKRYQEPMLFLNASSFDVDLSRSNSTVSE